MVTRKKTNPAKSTTAAAPVPAAPSTASYQHPDAHALIRPEAGAQTRFKKKKPAATWRYDSSLAPELQWDALNPAREQGEAHIASVQAALANVQNTLVSVQAQLAAAKASQPAAELHQLLHQAQAQLAQLQNEALRNGRDAAAALKALSRPFLNWAGKAEHDWNSTVVRAPPLKWSTPQERSPLPCSRVTSTTWYPTPSGKALLPTPWIPIRRYTAS